MSPPRRKKKRNEVFTGFPLCATGQNNYISSRRTRRSHPARDKKTMDRVLKEGTKTCHKCGEGYTYRLTITKDGCSHDGKGTKLMGAERKEQERFIETLRKEENAI